MTVPEPSRQEPVAQDAAGSSAERAWTGEQRQAIALRGTSLLVSAAAGAGKTTVLVERIVQRLLDPADPLDVDRLLVVTFTEAAATQMKDRIRERLELAIAQRPNDMHLRRQLALLGRASISTVHSFCLRIVRQYFYRLGLDPAAKVAGEHESQLLRYEVLDELFERRYAAAAGDFLALVEAYGGRRNDESLRQLVLSVYESAISRPRPGAWLDGLARRYREAAADLDHSAWFQTLRDGVVRQLRQYATRLAAVAAQCRQPGGPAVWADTIEGDARRLAAVADEAAGAGCDGLLQALQQADTWPRLPQRPRGEAENPHHNRLKGEREAVKKAIAGWRKGLWSRPAADLAAELQRLEPYVTTLVDLVKEFAASLEAAKRDRGLMDFSDMEHYALRVLAEDVEADVLQPSDVARELRRFYQEVLVDEYQDINPLQDAILRLVARDGEEEGAGPNLFMVGDVKQSIYAFRQAEPGLFLERYRTYAPAPPVPAQDGAPGEGVAGGDGAGGAGGPSPAGGPCPAAGGWRVELNANFRSRASIVEAVNDVFARIMVPDLGGLAYDDAARLRPRATFPEPPAGVPAGDAPVEVYVLERKPDALDGDLPDRLATGDSPRTVPEAGRGDRTEGSLPGAGTEPGTKDGEGVRAGTGGATRTGVGTGALAADGTGVQRVRGEGAVGGDGGGEGEDDGADEEGDEQVDLTALEREALLVARRIRDLVEGGPGRPPLHVWDSDLKRYRPVRYRDVVVLLRSAKGRAAVFVDVLSRHGVPVYTRSGSGYLAAPEVEMVLALLQVLDNPRQDIPLAAVLRSPVVGLDAANLARIRLAARDTNFYEAACRVAGWDPDREEPAAAADPATTASGGHGELAKRLRTFFADLARWRGYARRWPLSRVIQKIYDETGLLTFVAALPGGEQRRANLEALRERARQFDRFARQGLFRFLRFIERLRERGDDLATAPALGENDDVVRVMTIHQSKGLEFPVVVVADLGARFRFEREQALFHRELGLGLKVADPQLRIRYPSLAYEAVRAGQRLDTLAEELRILYVALTRAKERLILVGSADDLPKTAAGWWAAAGDGQGGGTGPQPLPAATLERARSYLDWLATALIHHPDAAPLRQLAAAAGAAGVSVNGPAGGWASGAGNAAADGSAGGVVDGSEGDGGDSGKGAAAHGWRSRWSWTVILRPAGTGEPATGEAGEPAPGEEGGPGGCDPSGPGGPQPVPAWLGPLLRGEPLPPGTVDDEAVEALRRRLAWRYPFAALANRFAKRSVSELKRQADPEWQEFPLPADLRRGLRRPRLGEDGAAVPAPHPEPALTGAERGTATHRVLQHLDLAGPLDAQAIARQVEAMVHRQLLTRAEAQVVDSEALARFFASPLGQRLRRAPSRVHREWMFTLGVPAKALYPDLAGALDSQEPAPFGAAKAADPPSASPGDDLVVVQGIVDCFVEEDDGLLLLDFKTDEPRGRPLDELVALYAGQIRFYRRALAEITGRPVKEAYLYFLAVDQAVPVT
ncbi:recombination helicase AddA [Thermaerobacter marianensis DSM 12885]|uniref:ATP-dependent helicase/nuclease subunit A n=1 Tax=Thermaerobacter marianensis (strain ATCC 700841 / DSM 12885 / JCM 10246 / 7p75a) TaxID=644966 RepID=E6SIJ4_THEM7|nr:UvrD-helicase domain-containing protein [Thermaerobacter marianensis]ADU50900.1 recombination helicase AddA [Thermaerobacter marianensis DSM 12885]